jgi:hypothetical protein
MATGLSDSRSASLGVYCGAGDSGWASCCSNFGLCFPFLFSTFMCSCRCRFHRQIHLVITKSERLWKRVAACRSWSKHTRSRLEQTRNDFVLDQFLYHPGDKTAKLLMMSRLAE